MIVTCAYLRCLARALWEARQSQRYPCCLQLDDGKSYKKHRKPFDLWFNTMISWFPLIFNEINLMTISLGDKNAMNPTESHQICMFHGWISSGKSHLQVDSDLWELQQVLLLSYWGLAISSQYQQCRKGLPHWVALFPYGGGSILIITKNGYVNIPMLRLFYSFPGCSPGVPGFDPKPYISFHHVYSSEFRATHRTETAAKRTSCELSGAQQETCFLSRCFCMPRYEVSWQEEPTITA